MLNFEKQLADAASHVFSQPVTGFLLDARSKGAGIRAVIFNDALKRYEDGDPITTSEIQEARQEHGYTLILTAGGCCYVVVSHMMFIEEILDGVTQTLILRAS